MHTVVSRDGSGIGLRPVSDTGVPEGEPRVVETPALAQEVAADETAHVRWTWDDTNGWYPALLAEGVRVDRAHDLRLAHAVLRASTLSAHTALAEAGPWIPGSISGTRVVRHEAAATCPSPTPLRCLPPTLWRARSREWL